MDDRVPASALPTLRQLQFLAALKVHGSFVRAAEAVGVTQPTLSAGIKELESILGTVLVDRARGAAFTETGEEAAERASRVLVEAEELVRAVGGPRGPLSGAFRLGAIPTIAPFLLPRALPALHRNFPKLRLTLREDLTSRLIDALRGRLIDAAVIALPYETAGVDSDVIAEDEFLLVAPTGHPLLSCPVLDPEDLRDQELLLLDEGHCLRDHALSLCRTIPGRPTTDVGAISLHTMVQMVAAGLGVTLAPRLALEGGLVAGVGVGTRSFQVPVVGRSLAVAWRAGSPRAAEAKLLAAQLRLALGAGAALVAGA